MQDILQTGSNGCSCRCAERNRKQRSKHFPNMRATQIQTNSPHRRAPSKRRSSDPFQVFQVQHQSCLRLRVKIIQGRSISSGWMTDLLHTPSPSVIVTMKNAAETQFTTHPMEGGNPAWRENFTFHLDPQKDNCLEIRLVDQHPLCGGELGSISIHISELTMDLPERRTLHFNRTSEVDVELKAQFDTHPNLRYSLCLCDEEKRFRKCRRLKAYQSLRQLLGKRAPDDVAQTPTIAVIGSGGGFRAMVGFSGAIKALQETGVLNCTTYIGALSGSSWYLSQLYAHPSWLTGDVATVNEDLSLAIDHSFLWLCSPAGVYSYMNKLNAKRAAGLPVSFTDFFGHLVGDTILKGRMTSRLSDQRCVVDKGASPLPLYTCVHVKKDVSARIFQEWMEFSPYEIGLPKYGIFMKSHLFGSKFFMGKVFKQFPEQPLHYLQGIWGSAFCILFRRLLQHTRTDQIQPHKRTEKRAQKRKGQSTSLEDCSAAKYRRSDKIRQEQVVVGRTSQHTGYMATILRKICTSSRLSLFSTRAARAGIIHNPLRGLSLQRTFPFSPFSQQPPSIEPVSAVGEFDGLFDLHPTTEEHLYLVDAGLTFNSPYPPILRQQRGVDIVLSYDFSARDKDTSPPFKELLLAERWARLNQVPFPPVDVNVWDPENPQEVYVFRHPTDPNCPIIIHFVLVNTTFRKFKEPGVERKTEEEKRFGDFSLFDESSSPYSTFTFTYSHEAFGRLNQLIEYNTRSHLPFITDIISDVVNRKKTETKPLSFCPIRVPNEGFKLAPMKLTKSKLCSKRCLKRAADS